MVTRYSCQEGMPDDDGSCCNYADYESLLSRHRDLVALATALADKLDKVSEDAEGIFAFANVHGVHYKGAQYGEELAFLRKALSAEMREKDSGL